MARPPGWRFAAIGQTTAAALETHGIVPYATAKIPDVEALLREFL